MKYKLIFTESYTRRAIKFLCRHPNLKTQYQRTLELLELDPSHPSLRLHKLKGGFSDLYSVSINYAYRITLEFLVEGKHILLVNVGSHDEVY